MIELKPCPFCGGEAELWDNKLEYSFYSVICKECDCMTPYSVTRGEAVEVWNRREPIDKIVEQLEEKSFISSSHAFEFSMSKYAEPKIVDERSFGEFRAFETAIEIVKGGVV